MMSATLSTSPPASVTPMARIRLDMGHTCPVAKASPLLLSAQGTFGDREVVAPRAAVWY